MRALSFPSGDASCAAWHLPATSDALTDRFGRPCVVMAHGFGGTRDTGLLPYAEGLAAAGLDVLLFDYRGFGDSGGTPRQRIAFRDQRADYRAAVAAARKLPDVDPERIVLWGTSYSGGHVVPVAAVDGWVAAVVSMTPAMDGEAAVAGILRHGGLRRLVSLIGHGLLDAARALVGLTPHYLPVVGPPDTVALIATPGAMSDYLALAGPTWRNEVCARTVLEVPFNRPIQFASRLRCPILVQIADHDVVAPPEAAHAAVARARARAEVRTNPVGHFDVHAAVARARARAEVRTYPIGHFDVYAGAWQQRALADQIDFLTRHLSRNRGRSATPTGAECALARHS